MSSSVPGIYLNAVSHLRVSVCLTVRLCVCVFRCICVSFSMHVYACLPVCDWICVCVSVCLCIHACLPVCLWLNVGGCVCVCVYVCRLHFKVGVQAGKCRSIRAVAVEAHPMEIWCRLPTMPNQKVNSHCLDDAVISTVSIVVNA